MHMDAVTTVYVSVDHTFSCAQLELRFGKCSSNRSRLISHSTWDGC